jgi:hypothetical protein
MNLRMTMKMISKMVLRRALRNSIKMRMMKTSLRSLGLRITRRLRNLSRPRLQSHNKKSSHRQVKLKQLVVFNQMRTRKMMKMLILRNKLNSSMSSSTISMRMIPNSDKYWVMRSMVSRSRRSIRS